MICGYRSEQIPGTLRGHLNHPELELVWVEVKPNPKRNFLLGCCYRPPQCDRSFFDKLETTFEKVDHQYVILLGDFDANNKEWYCGDTINSNGITKRLIGSF